MASRKYLSNDTHAGGYGGFFEHVHYFTACVQGEVTADKLMTLFVAPQAGKIVSVVGGVEENGSDTNEDLTMTFTVSKNGTAVCTTDPVILKNAASDAQVDTYAAGTGLTLAVLKTDGTATFAAGDNIACLFDITRNTVDTEITTPSVTVGVKFDAV